MRFTGAKTKKDAVVHALKDFNRRQRLAKLAQMLGTFEDFMTQDELEAMREDEKWDRETGFIHLSVDKYLEPGIRRQAFLCGPPLMIEAVTRVLKEKGTSDIFYDGF